MDPAFDRLATLLAPAVTPAQLIDALRAIRAPRHLIGIVPMARQFRDWRGRYPALNGLPQVTGYPDCLAILDRIAELDGQDDELMGRVTAHRNAWTPLRPWTGDSVIGELLLVQAEVAAHARAFEQVTVWLIWQAQRFHVRTVSAEAYARYLDGRSTSTRLKAGRGSRLYGAYLALQRLTHDEAGGVQLEALAKLVMDPDAATAGLSVAASVRLTLLARLTRLAEGGVQAGWLRRYALQQLGFNEAQLRGELERVRSVLPPDFARVLVTTWGGALRAAAGGGGSAGHRRAPERPLIRHGERLIEILGRVDEDEIHAGASVALFPQPPSSISGNREHDPDDPIEAVQLEPPVTLYLAEDDDLLRAHYGAKGLQAAVEYQNAQ
ncbi:MAG TPA: hypothetical protein VFQ88_16035, partial [Nevskiaceae bacterium]|nr:hypothetical protein [Nevskiaceae bacterium]